MDDNWPSVPLGEVGEWLSGGTPSKNHPEYWDGEVPWVSPKDMKVPRIRNSIDHVSESAIGNGTRLVDPGTLLMVVRGMILAHSFPVALTEAPVSFNQDMKALVPGKRHDAEFLLYWLQNQRPAVLGLVASSSHGTKRLPTEEFWLS